MKKAFLLFLILIFPFVMLAQQTVNGSVVDENGEPLPGVNVSVKGTTIGSITDINGNYSISVASGNTIVFTFVGYKTLEVPFTGDTKMDVSLEVDFVGMDEVVVIGYGTTTKKEVIGSVASVNSTDFIQGEMNSPLGAIKGKVAGLSVINTNGNDPTSGYTVRIRGLNSFSGGQSPLIIVDGTVWEGSLNMINPEQIKTFDILKDGSAAAIYGTRATNGVILITLKTPELGKVKFEFSSYVSYEAVKPNDFWLSADQYRDAIAQYVPGQSNLDKGSSTDWVSEVTQKPINQNYNLGITGGKDNIAYRANITYMDDQGLFNNNYSKIVSPSIFITQNAFNNRLSLDYKLLYSITESSNVPRDLWSQTVTRNPTEPVYDPTNTAGNGYYDNHIQGSKNPVAMLNESTYDRKVHFINAGMNADFKLIENLSLKFSASFNNWSGFDGQYLTRYYPLLGKTGEAYVGSQETSNFTIEPSISYKFDMPDNHHFQVMAGYSYYEGSYSNSSMRNGNFDTDKFSYHNIGAGKDVIDGLASMTSYKETNKLIAFYGRANYNYKDKYLASVSLRYEGSSRFGANNKWGAFPAFSVGWRLNEERFMEGVDWVNDLKIRAGVGVTGNQDIPNYQSIPTLSTRQGDSSGLFYYNGEWVNVYVPDNNPNPDLKWEKKTEYNLGIDFGLFNRLTGNIDLYKRIISDLLWYYNVPVPPNVYDYVYANVGEMTNKGIEVQLRADIIRKSNFNWNSVLTYSKNINELTKLSDPSRGYELEYIKYTPAATTWAQLLREGEPVGNYWAPIYLGMDESGKPIYEDIDGGGVDVNSIGDRRIVGNDYPDFEMGWQNSLSYRQFFLTFSFRAIVGQSLLNWDRMSYENLRPLSSGYNILTSTLDHPEYVSEITYDLRFVDNASFVKLDNLVFGYDFKLGLNNLRAYVSGSNLLTITNFNGNDPEQTIPGFNTDTEKFGGDNLTYPYSRTFLLGLKLNF